MVLKAVDTRNEEKVSCQSHVVPVVHLRVNSWAKGVY